MPANDIEFTVDPPDESIHFRRPRQRQDAEMDITPMIDVTFLMLIFFLVASRLSEDTFLELPPAQHGTAVSHDNSVIVTLTRGTEEQATVFLGDGPNQSTQLSSNDMETQQQQLEDYIEEGLTVRSKQQLLIKAEVGVRHRDVARVARAAGEATANVMYLAVVEEP